MDADVKKGEILVEDCEEYAEYGSCYFCGAPLTRFAASWGDVCEKCAED